MNVALIVPVVESVPVHNIGPLLTLCARMEKNPDIDNLFIIVPQNVVPHDAARIAGFDDAIKLECDLVLFIDDDTIPPFNAFDSLYRVLKEKKAVAVSGLYYRRGYPYTSVWSKKVGKKAYQVSAEYGVHKIHYSGLGCALIDVNWVVKNLKKPYFEMDKSVELGTTVTDDITFFDKIRKKRGKVFGNADVRCAHIGNREIIDDGSVNQLRRSAVEASYDPYSTHQKVLQKALEKTKGNVLEVGVGRYSTPIIHKALKGRQALSLDTETEWIEFCKEFKSKNHKFGLIEEQQEHFRKEKWGLVFVDFGHEFQERALFVSQFKDIGKVFVIHDSEEYPVYEVVESFKYSYTDSQLRPFTSVCSDTIDVRKWFHEGD